MIFSTTAERVRYLRDLAGLSQRMLSLLAGLHERHIGVLELRNRNLSAKHLIAVAKVLGASERWIVLGEGETPTADAVRVSVDEHREQYRARKQEEARKKKLKGAA